MTLREAVTRLRSAQQPPQAQLADAAAIVKAFRVFWSAGPTEDEFSSTMLGVVLLPAMLYRMVSGPRVVRLV